MRFVFPLIILLISMCLSTVRADESTTQTITILQSDLALMKSTLASQNSANRMAILSLFKKGKNVDLYNLDKGLWEPLKLSALDHQENVRAEAVRCLALYWIWTRGRQDQKTIDFLTNRMKEETRQVKYNAVYYGLGKVKKPSPELIELLVDEALNDHEPNYYKLLVQTLKRAPNNTVASALEDRANAPSGMMRYDASLFLLHRDVLISPPPTEWGLSNINLQYMRSAYLFSVQSVDKDNPMTHGELWSRINSVFPTNIYMERYRDKTDSNDTPILIIQINGKSGIEAVHATQKEVQDIQFGPVQEFPPVIRIFYEEELERKQSKKSE